MIATHWACLHHFGHYCHTVGMFAMFSLSCHIINSNKRFMNIFSDERFANVANVPKVWQSCPNRCKNAQNVANMPSRWQICQIMLKTWQTCPKRGKHVQNMASMSKTWQTCKQAQNVANISTVWQTCSKCVKHAHCAAIMSKMWQTCPQCRYHT